MSDEIICCHCHRPLAYDDAETIEHPHADGPLLVCEDCYELHYASDGSHPIDE